MMKSLGAIGVSKDFTKSMKEGDKVVLLNELKSRLSAYQEPLEDLRDSL